jgi:hypothetical protein
MKYEVVRTHCRYDQKIPPIAVFDEYSDAAGEVSRRGKDYDIREKLEMASAKVSKAEVFRFWFNPGWADFTVCEDTGELTIHSDWDDCLYRWNLCGISDKTFKEFLMRADTPYLASKLFQCKGQEAHRRLDFEKTLEAFKEQIESEGGESKEEMLEELLELEPTEYEQSFYHELSHKTQLSSLPDHHECFRYRPSSCYLFLRDTLLPFFQEYLRTADSKKEG